MTKRIRKDRQTVRFNGYLYQKYSDRKYWERVGGTHFLHRDVWIHHYGAIPEGFEIHHIDENPSNNAIGNLELLSRQEHAERHKESRKLNGVSSKMLDHLEKIRPLTKEWHASEAGHEWHKEHAYNSLHKEGKAPLFTHCPEIIKICAVCNKEFKTRNIRKVNCSNECGYRKYRGKLRDQKLLQDRTCKECKTVFHSVFQNQEYCSSKCRHKKAMREYNQRIAATKPEKIPENILCAGCGVIFSTMVHGKKHCSLKCKSRANGRILRTRKAAGLKEI